MMRKPPAEGWFWIDNQVIERLPEIGRMAFAIYAVLAKHTNKDRECFVSTGTLSKAVSASPRAVRQATAALVKAGLVEIIERRRDDGGQGANGFRLLPLTPQEPVELECQGGGTGVPGALELECHPRTRPFFEQDLFRTRNRYYRPLEQNYWGAEMSGKKINSRSPSGISSPAKSCGLAG